MKTEKSKQEKILDAVCWVILGAAAIYFGYQFRMGFVNNWYILFE